MVILTHCTVVYSNNQSQQGKIFDKCILEPQKSIEIKLHLDFNTFLNNISKNLILKKSMSTQFKLFKGIFFFDIR